MTAGRRCIGGVCGCRGGRGARSCPTLRKDERDSVYSNGSVANAPSIAIRPCQSEGPAITWSTSSLRVMPAPCLTSAGPACLPACFFFRTAGPFSLWMECLLPCLRLRTSGARRQVAHLGPPSSSPDICRPQGAWAVLLRGACRYPPEPP